jgi:hypothetical protein
VVTCRDWSSQATGCFRSASRRLHGRAGNLRPPLPWFSGLPSLSLLRRLASALNLHAADLFVIAGVAVPDELAPLDANAKMWVRQLVGPSATCVRAGQSRFLVIVWVPRQDSNLRHTV